LAATKRRYGKHAGESITHAAAQASYDRERYVFISLVVASSMLPISPLVCPLHSKFEISDVVCSRVTGRGRKLNGSRN